MTYAPIVRIIIRYGVGAVIGMAQAERLAADADIVTVGALALGACVESIYALAKRKGWTT